ncbi:hypothetical protein [Mesobacillus selenatarsenatis]|uniref:ABM domain-containing protein n=1 Tax=Mesobacillus selenatarsenatis (strain DSM 18680 / JCM 14380 / FERM P-15431 / SF-1) TaxID=1321606 RepID=A0A0A8X783_MESS1|nr:hypothetical protein [Mesobacillus selenatarsenatis]GAM14877.1 hypothetical protein SAMD00020551_3031 [Mesobacillus selenatarsenatis SF-1]
MFVKLYSYHIKSDKEEEYLKIQQEADGIYSSFIDEKTLHLQSKKDKTKWLEIHIYKNEKIYNDCIQIIDRQPEIQVLYKRFLEVITSNEEMAEEDYQLIDLKANRIRTGD